MMKHVARSCRRLTDFRWWTALLFAVLPVMASPNRRSPVVEAVDKALPAVVNIGTERMVKVVYQDPARQFRGNLHDQYLREFFGPSRQPGYKVSHSLGSGVIIDESGYILTNYHVTERASVIHVTLSDKTSYIGEFIAGDEISDLALIKIEPNEPLQTVKLALDDDLMLGESVIVMGNPFGLSHTVTVGVLSAKDREARYGGEVLFCDILQTDAAVNPGSSGGPMLNVDGELIGVNVAIYRDAQNIGFAVPVKRVRMLLAGWLSPESLKRIWLGINMIHHEGALYVKEIFNNSPASRTALRKGARIETIQGRPVTSFYDYSASLMHMNAGDVVAMTVYQNDKSVSLSMVFDPVPKPSGRDLAHALLGLDFEDVARETAPGKGLVIANVASDSSASRAGLRAGYHVLRINDREIRHVDDVGTALERVKSGSTVNLVLARFYDQGPFVVSQRAAVQLKID